MAENHGGDDITASGVEKHNAAQFGVGATRFEEIDEGLGRFSLNDAVGDDHVGTMFAAFTGFEGRDTETHGPAALLRCGRGERNPAEYESRCQSLKAPVVGGR